MDAYQEWICGNCGARYETQGEAEDCCPPEELEEEETEEEDD